MAIDWRYMWEQLNERQQAYLYTVFRLECDRAIYYESMTASNDPRRKGGEWRWIDYHESELERLIQEMGLKSSGTGATWEALDERGLIERKHTPQTLRNLMGQQRDINYLEVRLTTKGRKLCRDGANYDQISALILRFQTDRLKLEQENTPLTPKQKRLAEWEANRATARSQGLTEIAVGYDMWVPEACIEPLTKMFTTHKGSPLFGAESAPLREMIKGMIEAEGASISSLNIFTLLTGITYDGLGYESGTVNRGHGRILQLLPLGRGKIVKSKRRAVFEKLEGQLA